MDVNKYRILAKQIEDDFIENGRSYKDALHKIVIDVFDEMERELEGGFQNEKKCFCGKATDPIGYVNYCSYECWKLIHHD